MTNENNNTSIFGAYAQRYYDAALPVMPLHPVSKIPIFSGWQYLGKTLPADADQQAWINNHDNCNMGLVFGPQSNLCAVDIDSEDPIVVEAIKSALPPSDWERVGAKGMMLMYKRNPKLKNRNIADSNGSMIFELLCNSRQMVLPPSIHPDTLKPYTANKHLVDALPNLVMLPDDVEDRIRKALTGLVDMKKPKKFNAVDYVSRGGRDTSMTRYGGFLARQVRDGTRSVMEAITDLEAWCETKVESSQGDDIDSEKGVRNLLKFIVTDVMEDDRILPTGWDAGLTQEDKQVYGLDFGEDHLEWDYDQLITCLKDLFETTTEGEPTRYDGIEKILLKLSRSTNLDNIAKDRVIHYISKYSADGVTPGAYRKEIKRLTSGPVEGIDQTEIAEAVIARYEERYGLLRFVNGSFWLWQGDHWGEQDPNDILAMIATEFGALQAAKKQGDHKGILGVMRVLIGKTLTDSQPEGVNFVNGFVDKDLKLHEHHPDQGMTYVLPQRYLPDQAGNFPMFSQLLETYWSEDSDYLDKIKALQQAMCATIFGIAPRFQKAFILYGTADCGKSQLLEIVSNLVPLNASSNIKPSLWRDHNAVIKIKDKLLNIAGEMSATDKIKDDIFKEMIGGEPVSARGLYENFSTFRPVAAHWFASNWLPKSNDTTEGFTRRWQFFEFRRVIPTEDKILDIGSIIIEQEMEAIIAWVLEAYPELTQETKYTLPNSHLQCLDKLGQANSTVKDFLANCKNLKLMTNATASAQKLYEQYFSFVMVSGGRALSSKRFVMEIDVMSRKARGFDVQVIGGDILYAGIKIIS